MIDPKAAVEVRNVSFLVELMPFLEREIGELVKALENKIFSALNKGELTPQDALNAWAEKNSYVKLLSKFKQRVRSGQSIAGQYQTTLEKVE